MDENIGKTALQTLWEQKVDGCKRCTLHEARTKIVYGVGNTERPDYLFLGEAPGVNEDRLGMPFVGASGNLLNKILEAMQLNREDVYICNTIACWPPGNRDPKPEELAACAPVWTSQIIAVRPRMIIALGRFSGNALLGTQDQKIVQMRKKIQMWRKIPVQVTYHPSAMLRNGDYKQSAWEDLQNAMKYLRAVKAHEENAGPLFGGAE